MSSRRALLESLLLSRLPSAFQEVEYIESSGTQYIDTGFIPNQDSGLFIDYQNTQLNALASGYGGTRLDSSGSNLGGFGFGYRGSKMNLAQYGDVQTSNTDLPTEDLNRHTMFLNKTKFYKDNILLWTFANATFNGYGNLYIFKWNSPIDIYIAYMKLYSCQIYDNNTLVRDFIPCYRKSDNEIGLYDLANGVFYTNAGTGVFLKGADV